MEKINDKDKSMDIKNGASMDYVVEEARREEDDEVYDFLIRFKNGCPLYFKRSATEGEVKVCARRKGFDYYKNYLEKPTGEIVIPSEVVYHDKHCKVTEIEGHAFHNCTGVLEVTIPDTIKRIGEFAFFYCVSLRKIEVPKSVKEIGGFAFESCQSLQEFNWPATVTKIEKSMFCGSELSKIVIPDTVKEIGEHAFHGCVNLKEVMIPKSVEKIGEKAFVDCVALQEVTLENRETKYSENTFPKETKLNVK